MLIRVKGRSGSRGDAYLFLRNSDYMFTDAVTGTERMLFFVTTRGAPVDEDEWWSCGLDSSPDMSTQTEALRWHCRDSYVLAPPSRYSTGQDVRWVRQPAGQPLPDALRLLEFLVDACEEEGS